MTITSQAAPASMYEIGGVISYHLLHSTPILFRSPDRAFVRVMWDAMRHYCVENCFAYSIHLFKDGELLDNSSSKAYLLNMGGSLN